MWWNRMVSMIYFVPQNRDSEIRQGTEEPVVLAGLPVLNQMTVCNFIVVK